MPARLAKVVSGGQTGVDRAALDAARAAGIPCGGWIPKGRRAEDGPLPHCYKMQETVAANYATRTRFNVRDSDATLILTRGEPSGGTALTVSTAQSLGRPIRIVDLESCEDVDATMTWIAERAVNVLNVAGPRESGAPGIYNQARDYLCRLFGAMP